MEYNDYHEGNQPSIRILVEQFEAALENDVPPHIEQEEVEQIIEYYESTGHYDKALQTIELALVQHPYSGLLLLKKAQVLFDLKIVEEALASLDLAAIYEPSEVGIYLLRSEIYVFQSQHEMALIELERAHELAVGDEVGDVWLHRADVYEDNEEYDKVYGCLSACLMEDMENEEALSRINYCMELTENYADAINLHTKIIDEHPYNFWAWYNLSYAYASMELYEKAIDALQYVVAIDENVNYAYKDLAQYFHELKDYKNALESIATYREKTKAESDIYLLEGKCYFELGDLKQAKYCFRKAIRHNANTHEAFYNLGMTYVAEEKWQNAIQNLKKAVEIYPDNIDYLERLAEIALHTEDHEEVKFSCRRAFNINTKYSRLYITLALSYLFNEEGEMALETIDDGIEECYNDIQLRYIKAIMLMIVGKRKASFVLMEELLDENFSQHVVIFKYFPSLAEDESLADLIALYADNE